MKQVIDRFRIGTIVLLAGIVPAISAAQPRTFAGRPVADVLRELQTSELLIIFSSDLVPATLLVKAEPKTAQPRQIAQQILAPHGLALVPGPRGRLLVVPMQREARPSRMSQPAQLPQPPAGQDATPASGSADEIRIEERVDVTDRLDETESTPAVYTVEPLKIQQLAGGLDDVRRILQVMPGAAATNDRDGKMAVRGAGPEHNVIVLDGVQIHNPHRLGEFTSSFLNPATAASVALDASGLEARHGGRLSSVTVIETRDGRRDRRLAFSGSLGLTSGDVLVEGRLPNTETGTWWAGARGTYYHALMSRFGDAVPGFGDAQFKVSLRPSRRTRFTAFGLLGRETARELAGTPDVGNVGGGSPSQPGRNADDARATAAQYGGTNRLGAMSLWWTPGPRLASTTTASAYGHDARDYDGSLVIAGIPPFVRRVRVTDFALRQRVEYVASRGHLLDAGVEAHRMTSSWDMANVKQLDAWRGLGPSTGGELVDYSAGPVRSDLQRSQIGAWLQYRLPFGSIWAIEPGVRVEWNSFTRESSLQPRIRLSAHIGSTTVWTGVAVQAQTPSHESLLSFDYFHLTNTDGARLRNERSRQIVAGVEHAFGAGFGVRVEAYRRRFDRLLVQRLETDAERAARLAVYLLPPDLPSDSVILEHRPTVHAESTGLGSAAGVEVLLQRSAGRATGSFAYTFSRATREMYGHTFPFDFDRPHALTATASVQVIRQVRVSATWQRSSGFPITTVLEEVRFTRAISRDGAVDPIYRSTRLPNGSLAKSPSPGMRRLALRNTQRLNGYARTDLRGTYATGGPWELYAEVLNVFNRWNYVEKIQYTSGLGGLVSENNVYAQFERLPSFGVRVKF